MSRLSNTMKVEFSSPEVMVVLWKRSIPEGNIDPLPLSLGLLSLLVPLVVFGLFQFYENHQLGNQRP